MPNRAGLSVFAALAAALSLAPSVAHADDPKRPVPDYDGRPPPPATPGDAALWVPRVILFPPYVVTEYLIRRPLGALLTVAERDDWATTLLNVFEFGPNRKAGIVPTAFFDFGVRPSIGLYFFADDVFAKKNDLRAHVSYFGDDWVAAALTDRVHVGKASLVSLTASFVRRPDFIYDGEGPRTLESTRSRYFGQIVDIYPSFDVRPMKGVYFGDRFGIRTAGFHDRGFDGDPSIDTSVRAKSFAAPTDYAQGETAVYDRATLTLDSRGDVGETGVRASGYVEDGTDVREHLLTSWIKYGGSLGGALNVWDHRVVTLSFQTDFADPLRGGNIPFNEEVVWGGTEPMSGFLLGRLHGRSAAAATLGYSWPIWVWLDGALHASLGNTFDAGLRDFEPKLLRVSTGIGVQSTGSPDHRFELLVGFATETIDQGAKVDSFRLVFGGTNGF